MHDFATRPAPARRHLRLVPPPPPDERRVGLVLGAGGIRGVSWLVGALCALADETGWLPSQAHRIVGTSAGSVVGSLCASSFEPATMAAVLDGDPPPELGIDADEGDDGLGTDFRLATMRPPIGPGSLRMALSTLTRPRRHSLSTLLAGWLPRGILSTEPIADVVERFAGREWPSHRYWAVACDYRSGERVIFGRPGSPRVSLPDAVAASCAVPGFYHPVRIGDRDYIDGGACSLANADLLHDQGCDLVICLNPISAAAPAPADGIVDRVGALVRRQATGQLTKETERLRAAGADVLLIQPTPGDVELMGLNMMSRARRREVMHAARHNVGRWLRTEADPELLPSAQPERVPEPVPLARAA